MDQMPVIYSYEVEGVGGFPLDMLRHDCAWPTVEKEVHKIASQLINRLPTRESVIVRMEGVRNPTVARWKSFGWTVRNIKQTTV